MRVFDQVNEKDEIIGQATVEEFHSNPELIHRVVHFTLVDIKRKKVLITLRSFNLKIDPGKWCFLGEHVDTDENYDEALVRGAKHELGLNIKKYKELKHRIIRSPKQTEFARFFIINWTREKIDYDLKEVVAIEWLDPEELIRKKHNYSEQTRHWVEGVNWQGIFSKNPF